MDEQTNDAQQPRTDRVICGAKTRSGAPCQNAPVTGSHRCRLHGGKTPRGAASPHFKHGRRMRYRVPLRLVEGYLASLNDPELLDLNQSIALIDARTNDVLSHIDLRESGALLREMSRAYDDLQHAVQRQDSKALVKAMGELHALIEQGTVEYAAWDEVMKLLDDRRKHVETKQRIEMSGERAVSASELGTMVGALLHVVQTVVSSPKEKQLIADGVRRLIEPPSQVH